MKGRIRGGGSGRGTTRASIAGAGGRRSCPAHRRPCSAPSQRAEAEKLAEVLRETEIALEHAREGDVAVMAKAIQTTAQHIDATVTGTFENTLHYYSQIGDKAAATRRKNEEAKAETAAQPPNPA
jgi:hypothetical protein